VELDFGPIFPPKIKKEYGKGSSPVMSRRSSILLKNEEPTHERPAHRGKPSKKAGH